MVTRRQILSTVSLLEEYQIHLERKKSDNAKKISAKVKFKSRQTFGSPSWTVNGRRPMIDRPMVDR